LIYGNPLRILNGYDSFGNTCGVSSNKKWIDVEASGMNTENLKYLYFYDLKDWKKTLKLCVKECPREIINTAKELFNYNQKYNTTYCHYKFKTSTLNEVRDSDENVFDKTGPCPKLPIYESTPILNRCAPKNDIKDLVKVINSWDAVQEAFADLYATWYIILSVVGISLVLSILLIGMLHYLTQIVSWLICILVATASIAITVILWYTYYDIKNNTSKQMSQLEEILRNETGVYVIAIIATIVMIILLVIIYFMRSKFAGLAALFEEAGKCMYDLPGLVLPLFLTVVALIIFILFWTYVVTCLATAKVPVQKNVLELDFSTPRYGPDHTTIAPLPFANEASKKIVENTLKTSQSVHFEKVWWRRPAIYFYFVALIWTCEFFFACQQLVMAGSVAYWYFRKPTDSPVCDSMSKLVKYHLGSAAKGSFLITLFKIPRIILTYLYAK
jgi:solute carrier family 44 protein 1 (choline transporter-like protein)